MKKGLLGTLLGVAALAVIVMISFTACGGSKTPVKFSYTVSEEDYQFVDEGSNITLGIFLRPVHGDWKDYSMKLERGTTNEYSLVLPLPKGDYEYYVTINDTGLDMSNYCEGWYTPEAEEYLDDGNGGYNVEFTVR